jgi:threonyl-tRNA synthetase
MPRGATVRGILESFIKEELIKRGYQPVYTPNIGRLELYRTSGHFPYYRDAQYPPLFLHPLGQAVDTWLSLLEADKLAPESEQAFLQILAESGQGMADSPGEPQATVKATATCRFVWRSLAPSTASSRPVSCRA